MPKGDHKTFKKANGRVIEVLDEADYRKKLMLMANTIGCSVELGMLFDKWDRVLRACGNAEERAAMQAIGVKEISDLLDNGYVGKGGNVTITTRPGTEYEKVVTIDDKKETTGRN